MRLTITVCDVCKDPNRDARTYELREGARRAKPQLCDEHAAPFEAFLDLEPPSSDTPGGRGRRAGRVTTMEEIEAMKKQPRKK